MTDRNQILMIDDDVAFCEATGALLSSAGYAFNAVHEGEAGLVKARACRPDLILLDVMMTSDTEGFEVSRQVAEDDALRGVPVILMTGIRKAMSLPFRFEPDSTWLPVKRVLEKPVPPERLLAEVAQVLADETAGRD